MCVYEKEFLGESLPSCTHMCGSGKNASRIAQLCRVTCFNGISTNISLENTEVLCIAAQNIFDMTSTTFAMTNGTGLSPPASGPRS